LGGTGRSGFSPKAAYIFLKQLEEADGIVLNKIDKLTSAERETLSEQLRTRFPGKPLLFLSAREGSGIEALATWLDGAAREHEAFMDVDYDVYAAGEAELGWLNGQAHVESLTGEPFSLDAFALNLVTALQQALGLIDAEPAHLKVLVQQGDNTAIANLVGSDVAAELSVAAGLESLSAEVNVNARVAIDPAQLEAITRDTISAVAQAQGLAATLHGVQSFRPGRPRPTHRLGTA
jgi:G3E family GTPase